MQRITTATKVVDKFGAGKHGYTNGDVIGGIPATDLEADVFDNIQEEIANVIEGAGIALNGAVKTQLNTAISRGRLTAVRAFTATQVYTPTPGTKAVRVFVQGAGGSGGTGAGTAAGQCSSGAGGGAGGWARRFLTAGFSGVTITIGAAGTSAAPPAAGIAGGTTSFGSLVSATGGAGGSAGPALSNSTTQPQGFGVGGVGSLGDENGQGGYGAYALYGPTPISGKGGDSFFGSGAPGVTAYATGLTANVYGAGGSGGNTPPGNAGGASSGNGQQGICYIEEYS